MAQINWNDADVAVDWQDANAVMLELIEHLSINNYDAVEKGMTPLHLAARSNQADMAQQLIDRGHDVDAKSDDGVTPLSHAVEMGSPSVIKVLLAANADIFIKGHHQRRNPVQKVLAFDSQYETDVIWAFLERIRKDASGDSVAMGRVLLDADCPFPQALLLRDVNVTRYMLEHGSWIDEVDQDGNTALHYATRSLDWQNVELLIERGADVVAVNSEEQTPLHFYGLGCDREHKILRALLDKNVPLYDRDSLGYMAVTRIFGRRDSETVRTLLEYDVDLDATNADGSTLLHHAVYNEDPGVVQVLHGRKFDVNAMDVHGETPLWYALDVAMPGALKFLLDNGADLNVLDSDGYTAFFQGFYWFVSMKDKVEDCLKCIEMFLQYGADVDCVDAGGDTIFDYALAFNSFVLARPILEYVAMGEMIGKPVATNQIFLAKIDSHEKFRSHLEFCKRRIDKMKRIVIFEKVTLFKFLVDSDEKLEKYARNAELVEKLKQVVYGLRRSNLYFDKFLRRRVEKAIKTAELREKAALGLLKIEGLNNNDHVIEKILTFVNGEDLRNLCLI